MRFRSSLLADYTVPSAFIPLSLFSRFVCNCPRSLLRNSAVPYDTSRPRFPSHLLAASDSSPIRVRVLQQVRGSCSYVLCPHRQFHFVRVFPVFFPRTQTGYECVFLFFSLSQFYGCRNPRAPVFVVRSLFLFARAETQRRINSNDGATTAPPPLPP